MLCAFPLPVYNAMALKSILFFFFVLLPASHSQVDIQKNALLRFKASLTNSVALADWIETLSPCVWTGVKCAKGDSIRTLRLSNMGLMGQPDFASLIDLKDLIGLSIDNNQLEGPFPNLRVFTGLRSVFLSKNRFSGIIPDDAFIGLISLKRVHLDTNAFSGPIPSSLTTLPQLTDLMLQDNKFDGIIPDFKLSKLETFSVANNNLEGPIPPSLSHIDPASFQGNQRLAKGGNDNNGAKPDPGAGAGSGSGSGSESDKKPKSLTTNTDAKSSKKLIIIAGVIGLIAGLGIIAFMIVALKRRKEKQNGAKLSAESPRVPSNLQQKTGINADIPSRSSTDGSTGGSVARRAAAAAAAGEVKLSFVRDDKEKFELQDLLKASAEILGSGCFGSSYKAALPCGKFMVVKRFKQMNNVGREEFQEHMRRIGRLRHQNLLPLVAYYYRKEEKLLITDFVNKGSLALHLHGHNAVGLPSLNWATRLKIVKGVARGLEYLSKELPSLIAAHGHVKSSNILLSESYEPLISDYGLIPVINQESAQDLMVAYKCPEFVSQSRITKKTDVWGFGILILEIITGKFPTNFLEQGKQQRTDMDIPSWVNSMEDKSQVFDKEMEGVENSHGEVNKLLNIALNCCETEVEKRLDMKDAVVRIEDLKERDSGGDVSF